MIDHAFLQTESQDVFQRFHLIEPRPWDNKILLIELGAEIGSLAHAVLNAEGYKVKKPDIGAIKNETSDVLFVLLRISAENSLSIQREKLHACPPLSTEDIILKIIRLNGEFVCSRDWTYKIVEMIILLEQLADLYKFSLEEAYLHELKLCRKWQKVFLLTRKLRKKR